MSDERKPAFTPIPEEQFEAMVRHVIDYARAHGWKGYPRPVPPPPGATEDDARGD